MYVKTFVHTPRGCRFGCQTSQSAGKHAHQSDSLPGAVRSDVAARVILCVRDDRDVKRAFFFYVPPQNEKVRTVFQSEVPLFCVPSTGF